MSDFVVRLKEFADGSGYSADCPDFYSKTKNPSKAFEFVKKWLDLIPIEVQGGSLDNSNEQESFLYAEGEDEVDIITKIGIWNLPVFGDIFENEYIGERGFRQFMNCGIVVTYIDHSSEGKDDIKKLPFSFGEGRYPIEFYKELKEILVDELFFGLDIDIGYGYFSCYAELTENGLEWSIDYYLYD